MLGAQVHTPPPLVTLVSPRLEYHFNSLPSSLLWGWWGSCDLALIFFSFFLQAPIPLLATKTRRLVEEEAAQVVSIVLGLGF